MFIARTNDVLLSLTFLGIVSVSILVIGSIMRGFLRRQEKRGRRCIVCGYDLRASPEMCPECGMPTAGEVLRVTLNAGALCSRWPTDFVQPRRPERDEKMSFVHAAPSGRQADRVTEQLTARGVWSVVRPSPDDTIFILVPAIDADRARAVLALFEQREGNEG